LVLTNTVLKTIFNYSACRKKVKPAFRWRKKFIKKAALTAEE
jgi:hypothetical protein